MIGHVCDYSADFPLLYKPRTLPRNQAKMRVKTDYNKVIYNNQKN